MASHQQNTSSEQNNDKEYYVYPVLEGTNYQEHDADHPFCPDSDCPCHDDQKNMQQLQGWYDEGLIGSTDGDLIYRGKTI